MKTIEEIRLQNLLDIESKLGGRLQLCSALDKEPKYISQLLGRTKNRNIGSRVARDIERKLDLEAGFLDNLHSGLPSEAIEIARSWLKLSPNHREIIKGRIEVLLSVEDTVKNGPKPPQSPSYAEYENDRRHDKK